MSDLIVIEKLDPNKIFNDEEATKIIKQITDKVNEFTPDISNAKGRKEVSTIAAKVAKSKVLIDDMGKSLVAGWKADAKKVDIVRKKIRDELDELKQTTRAPLTEWEEADKARIANHEEGIATMINAGVECRDNWHNLDLVVIEKGLSDVSSVVVDQSWDEFEHDATVAKFEAISLIEKAFGQRKEQDEKDAELEKFRKQAEADDRARFEANAKMEAEKAERERTIEKNNQLETDKKQAIEAVKAAEERAEQAIKDTEDRVLKEIEEKKARDKLETEAREADTKHRGKINKSAMDAFILSGMDKATAKNVVTLIAKGMIPNINIYY